MDQTLLERMKQLSSAEEFFDFFGVPYEASVVHVNRLHILKRFYQYLHRAEGLNELDEVEMFRRYREMLTQAHSDFVKSNAATEKVFKVFQDADGHHVSVSSLKDSLAERRQAAASVPSRGAAA